VSDSRIQLVVNADDFGMTPAISRGIIEAHRAGIVTSVSLLGNCENLPAAKALLDQAPELGVGIHLSLIGGRPVTDAHQLRTLVDQHGAFRTRFAEFFVPWMRGRINAAEVDKELNAQIERAQAAGIRPDHLSTQRNLGFLPTIGQVIEAAARRHRIPGVRSVFEKPTLSWIAEPQRGIEAGVLSGLSQLTSWLTRRQMGTLHVGPQSWGYVEAGQLDEVRILEIIGRLGPGTHELICHPAAGDDPSPDPGPARYDRPRELVALTSPRVRSAIERRGIRLCRWRDLF
jgi:predicted glycoside hydrolase/deacetylase ChbG (UPF0249 family)